MSDNKLYPLKFDPIFIEKIWGGTKMNTILGKNISPLDNCGESWEISGIEGNESVVINGFLADNNLNELIEVYMGDLVGDAIYDEYGLGFPLLIKFIDAADDLSVQVHPNDQLAHERYGMNGKTELWYVIDTEKDAGLYVGFKQGVTQDHYLAAVKDGTIDCLLNYYPVKKGDAFLIPAGTVHAIGKGVLLSEIQQSSDITYRIFDWNRLDNEGNSRELHTDEALAAIDFEQKTPFKLNYDEHLNTSSKLLRSNFFNINTLTLDKAIHKSYTEIDSFVIYICTEGEIHLFGKEFHESIGVGGVLLVPANISALDIVPSHKSTLLEAWISNSKTENSEETAQK